MMNQNTWLVIKASRVQKIKDEQILFCQGFVPYILTIAANPKEVKNGIMMGGGFGRGAVPPEAEAY